MEDLSLRSALGVESCKWDTAGQFAIPLRQIDLLPYTDDVDRDYQWIAQQFYRILFRPFGKSLVDSKRRCAWYFGRDLPAHNHQVPDNFEMIRLVPQRHYICFYDTSSTDLKPKYIAKLDMFKAAPSPTPVRCTLCKAKSTPTPTEIESQDPRWERKPSEADIKVSAGYWY